MSDMRQLHLLGATGTSRSETWNGREYLVVPVVALMEGVIHAVNAETPEFVPFATLEKAAASWGGKPVMLGHPVKDGKQCSANTPALIEAHGLGTIRNSRTEGKKLLQDAWVDKEKAKKLHPDMYAQLEANQPIEVSVGVFTSTDSVVGEHNGKRFKGTWFEAAGDHLAFLPGGRGACSIAMGCGTHRAAMNFVAAEDIHLATETELETLGGPGSGNFGHGGRPGEQGGSGDGGGDKAEKPGSLAKQHDQTSQHHASARDMTDIAARPEHFGQSAEKHAENQKAAVKATESALKATVATVGKGDAGSRPGPYLTHAKEAVEHAKAGRFKEASISSGKAMAAHEQASSTLKMFQKMRGAETFAYSALSGESLDERIRAVNDAVYRKWNNSGAVAAAPSEYAYAKQVFDTSVIVEVGSKVFALPYDVAADGCVTLGEATEVKVSYIAAKKVECAACNGTGQVKTGDAQSDCPMCNGNGELRTAIGARNSDADARIIQSVHDQTMILGATCDRTNYKLLEDGVAAVEPQLRAACRCEEQGDHHMALTKEKKAELIAALTTDKYSGFNDTDVTFLEGASDARLEGFKAAAETNKAAAEKATKDENDLRAAQARIVVIEGKLRTAEQPRTKEQVLADVALVPELKALLDNQAQQEADLRETLIKQLKAANANTEEELKAMPTAQLQTLAKYAKVEQPDYSSRGLPVQRAASTGDLTNYAPPDPYAAELKTLSDRKAVSH